MRAISCVSFDCHRLAPLLTMNHHPSHSYWWLQRKFGKIIWMRKQKSLPSAIKKTQRSSPSDMTSSSWPRQRRQWQPTPVLLPGKSHGRRSLVGYSPWGHEELNRTEQLHFHALEKEMATHSSMLAWRIPGTGAWWAAVYGVAQI